MTRLRELNLRSRKRTFKETRELEGIEAQIETVDAEVARIEALLASPDSYRTYAPQTPELNAQLASARQQLA